MTDAILQKLSQAFNLVLNLEIEDKVQTRINRGEILGLITEVECLVVNKDLKGQNLPLYFRPGAILQGV